MIALNILAYIAGVAFVGSSEAIAAQPKYGPEATLLSQSQEYVRKNPAPDFWAMIPYYAAQVNGKACSVASVEMVVNAARSGRKLTSDDKLATQSEMMTKIKSDTWRKGVLAKSGKGVELDKLGQLVRESLELYGVSVESIETVHVDSASPDMVAKVRTALETNEKSSGDFIIANFVQKVFTGDAPVGHLAPVAAFDAGKSQVLIMDPDREWYEPYWVSLETFVKGMNTQDEGAKKFRGFVYVKTK